jgi:4-amino-4-deoxy-L-arabinose transferase-like glycosyltransferase
MNNLNTEHSDGRGRGLYFVWLVIVALFALGVFLRAYHLEDIPTYIHNDESAQAIYVTAPFFESNPPSPMWGFNNFGRHPNFGAWLTTMSVKWLGGKTLLSIRLGSMIFGVLSILFFTLFVRSWLGLQTAIFFLAAIAPFHLHVFYSRTGFHYIHAATFSALVSFLFARVVRNPSVKNSVLLGIGLGFALMVYAATLVLPAVVVLSLLPLVFSASLREQYKGKRLKGLAIVLVAIMAGTLISMGQHLYFIYQAGFSSRLDSQSVLQRVPIEQRGGFLSHLDIVWAGLERTLFFFFHSDGAGQYGYYGAPLEIVSYSLAGIGLLALLYRCVRLDPNAIYVLALGVATVAGSALMIEANFSPHLIIFALLIPLLCAMGVSTLCQMLRIRSLVLSAILSIVVIVPWVRWNYDFVVTRDERKIDLDTFLLRLPIDRNSIATLMNFTPFYANLKESFFQLRYPNARAKEISPGDIPQQLSEVPVNQTCPCLVIVPRAATQAASQKLIQSSRAFQVFNVPRYEADVFLMR